MKRTTLSLADYKSNLGDIHEKITSIVNNSFEDWCRIQEYSNSLGIGTVIYKPRTKAGIVHDHICHRIFKEFYDHNDIKVGEFNGVFGFLYKDLFFIRFKKMNARNFFTSNANTNQNTKYLYQASSIPGIPEKPTILYVGYSLDKTNSAIQGIYTACWDGKQLNWIDEHGVESAEQTIIDFSVNEDENHLAVEKIIKRVSVKAGYKKVAKGTGTN